MPNKLPWYPHEHDARNDAVIYEAMDRFGLDGYAAWFIILDLIHEHGAGDTVTLSMSRMCREFRSRSTKVRLLLDFFQTSSRLLWGEDGLLVTIQIEKVNIKWKNLRSREVSVGSASDHGGRIEREKEKERERDKQRLSDAADKPPKVTKPKPPEPKPKKSTAFQIIMDTFLVEYCQMKIKSDDEGMKARVTEGYKRYGRACRSLYNQAGKNQDVAVAGLHAIADRMNRWGMSWKLDTIVAHMDDFMSDPKEYIAQTKQRR